MNLYLVILIAILLIALLVVIFLIVEHRNKKSDTARILNTRVFLVTLPKEEAVRVEGTNEPPKDFRQHMSVAEQMFGAFSSLYSHDMANKILKDQQQISFEIVAQNGIIAFYVACPKMFEEMVQKQIQAYYPTAHVEKVKAPNIFLLTNGQGEFASATLKLEKRFVLPLKTYTKQESDPLAGITNAMSKLDPSSTAALQMIIKPTGDEWRRASGMTSKKIQEGKTSVATEKWYFKLANFLVEGFSGAVHGAAKPQEQPGKENKPYQQMTPMQDSLLRAISEKASKIGFEMSLRVITVSQNQPIAQANLQAITASFMQFGTPELNNFKVSSGNNEVVKDYILRRFAEKSSIVNTEELATLYHFPNHFIDTPNIQWLMSKEMPPPANLPAEGTVLGKSVYRGIEAEIKIKEDDRRRHIFMIGKTGTGKTTLFLTAIEQDIKEGKGVCYIDPLGDAIEDIMGKIPPERMKDVIVFDPSDIEFPMGLNLMEFHTPEQRDFIIQETIQIFQKLFDPGQTGIVGPQWEHWFRNAALTIMAQPEGGTLIDIPRIFTDDAFRASLVSNVTDPIVKSFWEQQLAKTADFHKSEMYNYFISKFGRFMTNDLMRNIIGQKKSAFNIRQVMDEGKILLINLSKGKIGEVNSALLGMVIVSKIQIAAFSRADMVEDSRKDFYLYVDEFQNFTTDSFATILSEARKYHLDLNITNQYIAQLKENIRDAVIGNAGTLISYRIGAADAEFLAKEFPGVGMSDMTNIEARNTYCKLLIDGTPSKPFSMKGIKSATVSDANIREQVRNTSRQAYSRPLAEINAEIGAQLAPPAAPTSQMPAGGNEPLNNL
ncbi:TPA: type IV secretory system conjugative DNA transfer family protein [Candidatus Berkelbacteria bacterium]|uniref:DUF8128 domain-containing protein n=1 Tax=Berkelbacteria bacterium GW2011_GWE1_39_12 TaxID=1618337 RepID=A0A0G4B2Q9_9BACT|nr:MAG: hypothetical protein UT28_C0001G0036 [Berkelbacteria bacterium GW2011_GWE1_39_12]HBO60102.1 type IV secretory system conjugative DNA transfer family protein [Candidatus Berkelbacteria bacterium]